MTEPIIPFVEVDNLPPNVQALLERQKTMFGMVHNSQLTYLHRPEIAKALLDLGQALVIDESKTLPDSLNGKLGIICSSINNCSYCTSHQCSIAAQPPAGTAGLSEEQITALISGDDEEATAFEQVCFDYARTASFDPGSVTVEMLENLKRELTTPQIVELAVTVGLWKMINTIHDTLKLPIEDSKQEYARFLEARS